MPGAGGVGEQGELQGSRRGREQGMLIFNRAVHQLATEGFSRNDSVSEQRMRAQQRRASVSHTSARPQVERRVDTCGRKSGGNRPRRLVAAHR